jgi:hypothetical protein
MEDQKATETVGWKTVKLQKDWMEKDYKTTGKAG